ncbi:MAG TPA: TetR/AcrR family transcriptional regulator [Candidatus Limnocylindrales bacterium]
MPRDTLTREQIVKAAIDLLDSEGLEGLNMRALGAKLGSAATAVYWHVGSKENLIGLAADQVWTEIELPDLDRTDWRTAAARMAVDLRAMMARHPWLVQAFGSFLVFSPGKARHDDHSLAVYEAAGFSAPQADQAAATVFTFVMGHALGPAADASLTRKLDREGTGVQDAMRDHAAKVSSLAAKFPRLASRLESSGAEYTAAPDNSFEFGLEAILDGLESRLSA